MHYKGNGCANAHTCHSMGQEPSTSQRCSKSEIPSNSYVPGIVTAAMLDVSDYRFTRISHGCGAALRDITGGDAVVFPFLQIGPHEHMVP